MIWLSAPGKGDVARLRLLGAAVELFGEKGLEGATVREIAARAGQNVAAIAYHFGSKEKLYFAVLEGVVRELRHRLGDVFAEIQAIGERREPAPAEALRLLKTFLREVYLRMISRDEAVAIVQLIVREQTQPTAGFDILYEQGFRPLHEGLCLLVGQILGQDPRTREIMVRTHLIMGQVYFFAMSREGILRRLGWKRLGGKNGEAVTGLLEEHIDLLLSGLAARRQAATEPGPRA
jgi:AcrR family transcriptional regulator